MHGGDPDRFAELDGERHRGGRSGAIDDHLDGSGKKAFGGGRIAGLVDRLAREAVEELVGHLDIVLPAHEADVVLERFLERRRSVDRDAIGERGLCRGRLVRSRVSGELTRQCEGQREQSCNRGSQRRRSGKRHNRDYR